MKTIFKLLGLALLAGGAYYGWRAYAAPAAAAAGPMAPQGPMEVPALRLALQQVELYDEIPGRTVAYREAEIRPQVDGILRKQLFTEGASVEAGFQLYQIDDALYEAAFTKAKADVARAEAALHAAKARAERTRDLVEVEAVSRQDADDAAATLALAGAELRQARANADIAKIRLGYTRVGSPIAGLIGKSRVTEGALVMASQPQPLATVTQLDPIFVDLTQTAGDVAHLKQRALGAGKVAVTLVMDGGQGPYKYEGELKFSDAVVDPATGTVEVRALFPNPDHTLLPGLFVRARLGWGSQEALLVPQKATQRGPGGALLVWVIAEDGSVKPTPVKVGRAVGDQWLVTEGLKAGDVVMVEGFMKLAPGMMVKPVFEAEARKKP